jgi:hypothetical protein
MCARRRSPSISGSFWSFLAIRLSDLINLLFPPQVRYLAAALRLSPGKVVTLLDCMHEREHGFPDQIIIKSGAMEQRLCIVDQLGNTSLRTTRL